MKHLASLLAALAVLLAFAGGGCAALGIGVFAAVVGFVAWLGELIALSEEPMNIGDQVEIIGAGRNCGRRFVGCVGEIIGVDEAHPEYGYLVQLSHEGKWEGAWFLEDSLLVEPPETRIDLSALEDEQLYAAILAVEMISNGYHQLVALGLAADLECDLDAIFVALRREIPLRRAAFDAVEGAE